MIDVTRTMPVDRERVFSVLADGWLHASWVVGTARIRDVDVTWPAAGSRLYHSVGLWPALVDDQTEVLACRPPERLVLRARGWPAGEAKVDVRLEPTPGGCRVTLFEDASRGPGRWVPRPVRVAAIRTRNTEALRRLDLLARGDAAGTRSGAVAAAVDQGEVRGERGGAPAV